MRGGMILVLALLVGAGVWLLTGGDPNDPGAGPAAERAPAVGSEPEPAPVDPRRTGMAGGGSRRASTGSEFRIPVTLAAHEVDAAGQRGAEVDRFGFRLTTAAGAAVAAEREARSGHVLQLGPGSYELRATRADGSVTAPTRFTISRDSEPTTLLLAFPIAAATLQLEVLDQIEKQRLDRFRLSIESRRPGGEPKTRFVPKPDRNPCAIPAAVDETLVVRVEAPGYEPAPPLTVRFDASGPRTAARKVFLLPSARHTGVTLRVTDGDNQPIPHLEVTAEFSKDPVVPGAAASYAHLWRRRTGNPMGVYTLPELAPGHHRLKLRGVDAAGVPTLHLPHSLEFPITGTEQIREDITLLPGGAIELHLTDATTGRPIGKDVSIRLTHPDGRVHPSIWFPIVDGKPDLESPHSADHLLKDHPARLDPCLPPGRYTIELRFRDRTPVQLVLDLSAGQLTTLETKL